MPSLFQTDERAFRTCILYEAVTETPVEEAYKRLKKLKPNLDYLDFEYWYFRFLNGNEDLDHDKSTDPKTAEFFDIPTVVMERIVGKLNAVDRLSLRKVSRTLRTIVDKNRYHCESVRLRFGSKTSELSINNSMIKYKQSRKGFTDLKFGRFSHEKVEGFHWQMAMKDFLTFIKNPNWTFKTLKIDFGWRGFPSLFFENSKIHVEDLYIASISLREVPEFLSFLNSDVLKKIRFETKKMFSSLNDFCRLSQIDEDTEHMEKIMEMDHWKNAEELHFTAVPSLFFEIENLFHTKKFTISKCDVTEERLEAIRDILLKSPTFEYCSLRDVRRYRTSFDSDRCVDMVMGAHAQYDPSNGRYSIDGSNDYFKISYKEDAVDEEDFILEIKRIRA